MGFYAQLYHRHFKTQEEFDEFLMMRAGGAIIAEAKEAKADELKAKAEQSAAETAAKSKRKPKADEPTALE